MVTRDCAEDPTQGGGACHVQDAGVAEATVELRSAGGGVLEITTTDDTGAFQFRVAAGTYSIRDRATGVAQERSLTPGETIFVTLVVPA